jgi:hypothetical protein
VDAAVDPLVDLARIAGQRAVAVDQFDLQVVQRVEVGEAVLDRARQQRVAGQPFMGPGDGFQARRVLPCSAAMRLKMRSRSSASATSSA